MLETLEIATGDNPQVAVMWMHGLGTDGNDFAPIVGELALTGCPAIRFVFPHAREMPVTINGGYVMRAWYDIVGTDIDQREDEPGLRTSQHAIEQLIKREHERGIAYDKIVLAGFSQGCAMALQTGLRSPHKLAGIMGLSGYLPLADKLDAERAPANQGTPIFLAHGQFDPVIPIGTAQRTRTLLEQAGYAVQWHDYPMPHSVCPDEIQALDQWLQQVLKINEPRS